MEGDAGTSRLNPTDADDSSVEAEASVEPAVDSAAELEDAVAARPSRLGCGWFAGVAATLLVLAVGAAAGGYFALRADDANEAGARNDAAAVAAARDCVTATNAPDTAAMAASQQKIIECSTGDFLAQATLYSGVLVDVYQAANVQVQVSDMRAAVERHNDDGSIEVMVALRTRVSNSEAADQEQGYRLRVRMAQDNGQYKIARLEQVTT